MTKVFKSSTISKILSTNQLNTIEVNKDNIIEADSQLREVIQKGYLLTQINLSTIPDIIQEAIDNAILDAKTQTLADSLISTMRQTIENFDDGVYKKTYIDTTITYLEQLLTQKVSPEIAASIAEAKIAVATAEFATASQVGSLSSRVGSSESEILNVKETINTKDTARATQVEELQASINQSLSNYSEAIDLYVDANGNVKSQKIEKLEAGNSISKVTINELNEVVVDENGNYNAMVAKVIFDSDGKIVGFNFSDTNELTTFTINADVFKISNSTNTRTPFRIENNELFFDGKVTFSNITDKTSVITMENVETAIRDNVTVIDGNKIATSSILSHHIDSYAITGKKITGGTIDGTDINGVRITGAIIKASYIDYTTNLALSNWQYFKFSATPQIIVSDVTINSWSFSGNIITCNVASGLIESSLFIRVGNSVLIQNLSCTINPPNGEFVITEINYVTNTFKYAVSITPSGTPSVSASSKITSLYEKNFARNSDITNSLVVDNLGYIRLPAQSGFKTTGTVKTIGGNFYGVNATYNATHNEVFNIYSYDDYTINTLNRVIFPDVNTSFLSGEFKIVTTCGIQFDKYIDGSFNYYDFNISFLGDTIQGYAYINTNSSGPSSNSHWSVNGENVGSTYTKTKKGITYTLTVIPEAVMGYYIYKGRPIGELQQMGHSFVFTITADFSGNKTILGYTQGDLIQLINSNGLMNAYPDDATNPAYGIFNHVLKYPVLNVQ